MQDFIVRNVRAIVVAFSFLPVMAGNLFADGDLFHVCYGTEVASKGGLYEHTPQYGAVTAFQVLEGGALAKMHKMFSPSDFAEEKIIFVKMNVDGLTDGLVLPRGLYRCVGVYSYQTALGSARTVSAFEKLSREEEQKIYQEREEEEKRLAAELRARAIKEQPERRKIAESVISGVDLSMGCIRIEKSIATSFKIRVKNFMWKHLEACKAKGDVLGFLNFADDIINNRLDPTTSFDLIPNGNVISNVCNALKHCKFRCDVSASNQLTFLVPNKDWSEFVYCCKNDRIRVATSSSTRNIWFGSGDVVRNFHPSGVLSYAREKDGLAVLGDEMIIIGVRGSVEKYNCPDLEKKVEVLSKNIHEREISLTEYKSEILTMDHKAWEMIKTELIPVPHGAELESLQSQEKDRLASDLSRARAQFAAKVSELSFCLGDHIVLQRALMDYVYSVETDKQWIRLSDMQQKEDWEGIVRLVSGESADLNDAKVWDSALKDLETHKFEFCILFTRKTGYYQLKLSEGAERSFCHEGLLNIRVGLADSEATYVYAEENYGDPLKNKVKEKGFDIVGWLRSHPVDMKDPSINVEFQKIPRQGVRNAQVLLERKKKVPKTTTTAKNAKVDSATAKKDRVALQKALKAIPEADAQKSGDRERRLAKIMQDTTVVKLHEKYTGRKCAELLTEFKREWKEAANAPAPVSAETPEPVDDSELQTIDNRIAELKNLCHAWALRKRGLARTPPAVLSAEKEIKELEKKKSAIRMDKLTAGSRARNAAKNAVAEQRNAVYRKYKGMTVDDLVTAIEGCVSGK